MGFEKGKPKTGGRKPGTPNRTTANLRELLDSFLADNFEEVCREFAALEGKDKIAVYVKLLEFGLPKRSHAEIMADGQLRLQTEQITGMVIK